MTFTAGKGMLWYHTAESSVRALLFPLQISAALLPCTSRADTAALDVAAPKAQARADLAELGLAKAEQRLPWQLSGGMAQRLAFAAARAGGAQITVADESTKGLDADRRDDVLTVLREELAQGGLLTITHDLALAAGLGGEILVMQGGRVVERCPAKEVLNTPHTSKMTVAARAMAKRRTFGHLS